MGNIIDIYRNYNDKYIEGTKLLVRKYDKKIVKGIVGTIVSKKTIEDRYRESVEELLYQYRNRLLDDSPIIDLAYRDNDVIYLIVEEQYYEDNMSRYHSMIVGKILVLKKENKDAGILYEKLK